MLLLKMMMPALLNRFGELEGRLIKMSPDAEEDDEATSMGCN
jgi:hypothetical protein